MPYTRRVRILIATNLVALVVAWMPGLLGSEYSESVRLYVQGGASVWLVATNLYLTISGPRQALAEMRHRHQRELAELAERHQPSR
jgi:hypothetical protein